jgi:hypothetical protein
MPHYVRTIKPNAEKEVLITIMQSLSHTHTLTHKFIACFVNFFLNLAKSLWRSACSSPNQIFGSLGQFESETCRIRLSHNIRKIYGEVSYFLHNIDSTLFCINHFWDWANLLCVRYYLISPSTSYAAKKIWKGNDVEGCKAILRVHSIFLNTCQSHHTMILQHTHTHTQREREIILIDLIDGCCLTVCLFMFLQTGSVDFSGRVANRKDQSLHSSSRNSNSYSLFISFIFSLL